MADLVKQIDAVLKEGHYRDQALIRDWFLGWGPSSARKTVWEALSPKQQKILTRELMRYADGYGRPGYIPSPWGAELAAIKDSSAEAQRNMARAIQKLAKKWGIAV